MLHMLRAEQARLQQNRQNWQLKDITFNKTEPLGMKKTVYFG